MQIDLRPRFIDSSAPAHEHGRLGVIDIGSSMVRLVVYDCGLYPHLYLNHKVWSTLGKGKGLSGFKLERSRVERTLAAIDWFLWVCKQSEVKTVLAIASSAVREAENGQDFVKEVKEKFGLHVEIISGEAEASLSATGALVSIPDADGVVVDLGGGSLDICSTKSKKYFSSYPLGVLTLQTLSKNNPLEAEEILYRALQDADWAKSCGKDLIALGSGMRSIARLHMAQTMYPLRILHDYQMERDETIQFCEDFMHGRISNRLSRMTRNWREILPYRAAALRAMLRALPCEFVRFAAFGVREGVLFSQIDRDVMVGDPLIAFARDSAERDGRGIDYGNSLYAWVKPYVSDKQFPDRLLKAAALFSETRWREDISYRAHNVFEAVYGGAYVAANHYERVMLSLISFFRHEEKLLPGMMNRFKGIVSDDDMRLAKKIGTLFQLASYLDPGARGKLEKFSLKKSAKGWEIDAPDSFLAMESETVEKAMNRLNKSLHLR